LSCSGEPHPANAVRRTIVFFMARFYSMSRPQKTSNRTDVLINAREFTPDAQRSSVDARHRL
jgi:hypothetical protein